MTDPTHPETPEPDEKVDGKIGRRTARMLRKVQARSKPSWAERHGKLLYWSPVILTSAIWILLGAANAATGREEGWLYPFLAFTFSGTVAAYGLQKFNEFKRGWRDGYLTGSLDVLNELAARRLGEEPVVPAAKARLLATGDMAPQPWEPIRIDEPRRETTS